MMRNPDPSRFLFGNDASGVTGLWSGILVTKDNQGKFKELNLEITFYHTSISDPVNIWLLDALLVANRGFDPAASVGKPALQFR
ncbi:hypothetical protein [Parasphingorhabdus halotolerans]|uniref:Uncharacterized protein n=1 Tax=Parasphingorhabdus halotolerans TaxID=2725558 RepID=A0A6H2DIW1_9SPHN|nr:hypothetical protein [Parasphingorhabdus halotolerans]QJB67885.1 hypothetical protein HF685_09355 [Parasphingorhabdus halotolerans]